jgi:protoheme IX farnesyltransferase
MPASDLPTQSITNTISDYVNLTKPRIQLMLLITALGGMFLAANGPPPLIIALLVMSGGSLAAGGASAINNAIDWDIDQRMRRTRSRPVADGRIGPKSALIFGIILNMIAFGLLAIWVNYLSACLTLGATLFYVLIYTKWLKRSTTQNIVIGGAAGAIPPVVGWAAITGGLGLPALYLFSIIFFWTPPHFWALSLLIQGDYEMAGVPMLPVVKGIPATTKNIFLYTVILVTITILFFTIGAVGFLYLFGATVLGSIFLYLSYNLIRSSGKRSARNLYLYSLLYLALMFGFIILDSSWHLI